VTITGADPPVGLTGNYHITAASALIDRGVRCSNATVPAALPALLPCTGGGIQAPIAQPSATNRGGGDIDGQFRPMARTTRIYTLWDLGADELIGIPVPLP
jgi:hypothetical protein